MEGVNKSSGFFHPWQFFLKLSFNDMNFGASLSTKSLSNPEILIFKDNYVVYSLC